MKEQSASVLKNFKVGKRRGKVQHPSVSCIRNMLVPIDAALRSCCVSIDENERQLHALGDSGHCTRMPFGKKKRN